MPEKKAFKAYNKIRNINLVRHVAINRFSPYKTVRTNSSTEFELDNLNLLAKSSKNVGRQVISNIKKVQDIYAQIDLLKIRVNLEKEKLDELIELHDEATQVKQIVNDPVFMEYAKKQQKFLDACNELKAIEENKKMFFFVKYFKLKSAKAKVEVLGTDVENFATKNQNNKSEKSNRYALGGMWSMVKKICPNYNPLKPEYSVEKVEEVASKEMRKLNIKIHESDKIRNDYKNSIQNLREESENFISKFVPIEEITQTSSKQSNFVTLSDHETMINNEAKRQDELIETQQVQKNEVVEESNVFSNVEIDDTKQLDMLKSQKSNDEEIEKVETPESAEIEEPQSFQKALKVIESNSQSDFSDFSSSDEEFTPVDWTASDFKIDIEEFRQANSALRNSASPKNVQTNTDDIKENFSMEQGLTDL